MSGRLAILAPTQRLTLSRHALLGNLPLILLCLLPIFLYVPFAASPFERDEGVYATIAQGLLNGDVPYRDLFDNKPPLVYGWYALSFLLFGESVVAPRVLAALILSCTTLAIFGQARALFSRRIAYVAAGVFAIATGLPFIALHANTEAYMLLPLVTSLVTFTVGMRRDRLLWFALTGALGGLAVMTKQVAIWNLVALAFMALVWRWRSTDLGWRTIKPVLSLLAGSAAAITLIATPFFAVGALDDLIYANFSYNRLYVGALTFGDRLGNLGQGGLFVLAVAAPLILGGVLGLLALLKRQRRSSADYLLIAWAVASALGVITGGRFFPHYFLHLVPAMAILSAIVVSERLNKLPKSVLAIGVLLAVVSLGINAVLYAAPWRAQQRVAETVFYQKRWEESSQALGAYIEARTSPEDTIFNIGRESQIYFYADRQPAVQYFYDWAYQYDERTLPVTMDALRKARPVYIIDSIQEPLFQASQRPQAVEKFLVENYEYEGRVYFADIYRLKSEPSH